MFVAPLLLAILLAIAFPRFMRFVLGLAFFAVLFVIASFIDHAHAESSDSHETLIRQAGYFANCTRGMAVHTDKLHKIIMLGGDAQLILIHSCGPAADSYVHWCLAAGHDEKSCYGDLRFIAADVLKQYGN